MIKVYSFITILFFSTNIYATNIAVIDINFLINNSEQFKEILKKINSAQIEIKEKFNNIEQDLLKIKLELEESKLILSNDEFNLKKEEYYKKVAKFEDDVTKFNNHYENEIINIKNIIFAKISELAQDHASQNGIELIFEKNQYLIATDSINITQVIFKKLNESEIDLKFNIYEN